MAVIKRTSRHSCGDGTPVSAQACPAKLEQFNRKMGGVTSHTVDANATTYCTGVHLILHEVLYRAISFTASSCLESTQISFPLGVPKTRLFHSYDSLPSSVTVHPQISNGSASNVHLCADQSIVLRGRQATTVSVSFVDVIAQRDGKSV